MHTMVSTNLRTLRLEAGKKAQEDFAREAGLRVSTYRNIEHGRPTTFKKASIILLTLNKLREDNGLSCVTLEETGIVLA